MSLNAVSVKIKSNTPTIDSVSYNKLINVKVDSQQDYKIKKVGLGGGTGINRLVNLLDVDANNPAQGDSLVFNEITQKYESRILTVQDLELDNLDAGLF